MARQSLTIITGPTGVGKSAYAVALATTCQGEILNADSQQVYRGCDIGTGKLPLRERRGVVHHLLDAFAPDQQCNAAQFVARADAVCVDIHRRGHRAIVVGGTGLYLRSLMFGLCDAPPSDPACRQALQQRYAAEGGAALRAELARSDPDLAGRIHPHHATRLIRALEVRQLTGESIRVWQQRHTPSPRYEAQWIGLAMPRGQLHERIADRIRQQLAAGWLTEVERLSRDYGPDIAILQAIGYRELLAYLHKERSWDDTVSRIMAATRQYAKRQMTYLRRLPMIEWITCGKTIA
ncbi:MAG: tRNA (adenosine(37)-N6)-dimethylallyltransferase MiaA [Deltaproteobacteria bacterium]|nr:tRNA (adenosine(37)-N6)-dimethylallyltransferase MiaA [Deltaproteobacteria bacterium]